jgi:glycosyltransferase involved in cell wall biosynthesis
MHILLIHQAFASIGEPGGTRHHEFARELAAKGHQVTVIASPVSYLTGKAANNSWCQKEFDGEKITILRAFTYSALHKSFFHRVLSFISFMVSSFLVGMRVHQVDLVWGTSPPIFQGFTAWLIARLKGARFLFEVRDLWPAFAIAVGVLKNKTLIRLSNWLERFLYKHADTVMINSPGFHQHVLERGAIKIVLIPNGADPAMFDGQSGEKFRRDHELLNKFVAMYTGAHGISNDLQVSLKAANILADDASIHFVFVGDGKEKQDLIYLSNQLNLTNVTFLPSVPKNQMAEVIAASDACIAILKPLDLYKTTYPNKVFDTMAAGKPVLLCIDGVIREVVDAANAGLFCQPGDPIALADGIRWMKSHQSDAQKMGENGKKYLQNHFSRSKLAQDLEYLLKEMVG